MFLNSLAPILPHKLLSKIDTPAATALDFTPHLVKLPGTYSQKEAASIALTMLTAPNWLLPAAQLQRRRVILSNTR